MRIAYVTETYPPEINGVSLTVARTVEHLRRRDHRVELIRPRQTADAANTAADELLTMGCPIPMYPDLRIGLASAATLRQRFERTRPDLVHIATEGPLGWSAMRAAQALEVPVTSDFRTNFQEYSRYYGLGWLSPMVYDYLRRFHNHGQCTFVPTEHMHDRLREAGFTGLRVVGRGVDTARFSPAWRTPALREQWDAADGPVLLYVGRLAAEKNVALALCAFDAVRSRLPQATMVVVGDGPLRKKLEADFPQARFVGALRDEELSRHYASSDLFLFPSTSETFGNVTIEALASGLPVIAFDCAAAGAHVSDCDNGLLVPVGAERAFVAAVCSLAWQHGQLDGMRAKARQAALHLNWNDVLGRFESALMETAAAHAERSVREAAFAA